MAAQRVAADTRTGKAASGVAARAALGLIAVTNNKFRLGAHGLTSSEIVLVESLLRLSAYHRTVRWVYAAKPPYDAILLDDPNGTKSLTSFAQDESPYVLRLTRIHAGSGPGRMERPIRSEKLFRWLDAVERELSGDDHHDAGTDIGADSGMGPTKQPPAARHATPSAIPRRHPASPRSASGRTIQLDLSKGSPRLRLRRWPPATFLRSDPDRIRMATLLSRRALNAQDLHRLTGLDGIECLVFMRVLRSGNLLVVPVDDQQRSAEDQRKRAVLQQSTGLKRRFTWTLVRELRKRLGWQVPEADT